MHYPADRKRVVTPACRCHAGHAGGASRAASPESAASAGSPAAGRAVRREHRAQPGCLVLAHLEHHDDDGRADDAAGRAAHAAHARDARRPGRAAGRGCALLTAGITSPVPTPARPTTIAIRTNGASVERAESTPAQPCPRMMFDMAMIDQPDYDRQRGSRAAPAGSSWSSRAGSR